MYLRHFARLAPLFTLLLALAVPPQVAADHCGATATISPTSGPPGTVFVFETNLGAPSDLALYRNGHLVKAVYLIGDAFVRYKIGTTPDDAGDWRARAEVRGQTDCAAEGTFTVLGTPDTSTAAAASTSPASSHFVIVAVGVAAFGFAIRRLSEPLR